MLLLKTVHIFNSKFPGWKAIVKLKCDPARRRVEDAKFEVIDDDHNPRVSRGSYSYSYSYDLTKLVKYI